MDRISSPTLHQLRVFATVAREGSFVGAADTLLISVPSVSDQIRSIEQIVGARLLDRSSGRRGVTLTEAGTILLRTYEEIEGSLEHGLHEIRALQAIPERATVSFGASLSFGGYAFPRMYEVFHRLHAGITVDLQIGNRIEVLEGLRHGRLELGVVLGPVEEPDLIVEPLSAPVQIVVVGQPGHRLAGHATAPFAELSHEQLVVPGAISPISQAVERLARAHHTHLNVAWRVTNIETQSQAIASGVGIGATVLDAVEQRIAAGQLSLLNVEGFPLPLQHCLTRRPGQLSPAASTLRDFMLTDPVSS